MSVAMLPDLNVLPAEALKALILAQHHQLIATREQLLSRENEIEHLKLLITKLQRTQFGRKSEKLQRQIEQLELRLEELQGNREETSPVEGQAAAPPILDYYTGCETGTACAAGASAARNPDARAEASEV